MDSMDTTWTVIAAVAVLAAVLLGVAVRVLVRLVRTRRSLERAGLPTGPRWVFWGAVAYLLLPTDLLPDPIYLDDIGVLLLALRSMRSALPADAWSGTLPGVRRQQGKAPGPDRTPAPPTGKQPR